jgi:L-lactate dehydrogenase complex protein LldG
VEIPSPLARFKKEFEAISGHAYQPRSIKGAREKIIELWRNSGERPVAVGGGLPFPVAEWLAEEGAEVLPLSPPGEDCREEIARAGLGITGCNWAIAETGTIILLSSPESPRLYSLLPEVHLALVPEERIIPHLSAAGPLIREALAAEGAGPSCVNLITGPSRSADIGLTLIVGVHGPCEIHAIITARSLGGAPPSGSPPSGPFSLEDE